MIKKPRVIIYDDKDMQYIVGDYGSLDYEPQFMTVESLDGTRQSFPLNTVITMSASDAECLENIKLDSTLMKRIAVFNKEQECKRLDKEIHDKRQQVKEIEAVLEDRERRLNKLKEFITHIYEIDVNDDDWDD